MLDKKAAFLASSAAQAPPTTAVATAAAASASSGAPVHKEPAAAVTAAAALASAALADLLSARDPEIARKLEQLKQALTAFVQPVAPQIATTSFTVQVDKIFQEATDAAQRSVGKLETSFNTIMDRVSQRFALEMRLWTVAFAFALAFRVHLDSYRLLDQLSTNADVRSALVNMRDGMLAEADTVLPPEGKAPRRPEIPVSTRILNETLDKLKQGEPGLSKVGQIPDGTTTVSDAAARLSAQPGGAGAAQAYRQSVVNVLRAHAVDINQTTGERRVRIDSDGVSRLLHV
jgi:hypothetical protein